MTGSFLLNRQHSSTTASDSNKKKTMRPKYRRYSSADERNSFETVPDENQTEENLLIKVDPISSDNDSGIEDFDQQTVHFLSSQTKEEEEEDSSTGFTGCPDEEVSESSTPTPTYEYVEQQGLHRILDDLNLTADIPHEEKKEFCSDTREVFHGEFARLISFPISSQYANANYHLFAEDEVDSDPCGWPYFAYTKLDNAKAQFKCPNPGCCRLWTSMRARISFKISCPHPQGFVVLKIFGQNCQFCETPADALWYMEEVCRVMENLSKSIFERFFPSSITSDYSQGTQMIEPVIQYSRRSRHDSSQRKGKMHAPHDKTHCEACQYGLCFN